MDRKEKKNGKERFVIDFLCIVIGKFKVTPAV